MMHHDAAYTTPERVRGEAESMRFIPAMLLAGAVAGSATAQSVRIDQRIIQVGDSEAHVVRVAGPPDRIVTLEARAGGAVGERWTWYHVDDPHNDRSLVIRMRDGRVVDLESEVHR